MHGILTEAASVQVGTRVTPSNGSKRVLGTVRRAKKFLGVTIVGCNWTVTEEAASTVVTVLVTVTEDIVT